MTKPLPELKAAAKALKNARRVICTCHVNPDGDALGATLAFANVLKAAGKEVYVFNTDPVPHNLGFLPGSKWIRNKEPDFKKSFDLCVISDSGSIERPGVDLKGWRENGLVKSILNVDHHKDNTRFGDINYIDLKASSSGECAYDIIRASLGLNQGAAVCCYTAIITDTGAFRYSNTSPKTMRVATDLMERFRIDPALSAEMIYMTYPATRIFLLSEVLPTLEMHLDGKAASIFIRRETMKKYGGSKDLLDEFVNYPRGIEGVEVAVFFKEAGNSEWRISLRSKRFLDVGAVCNRFGGGGHARAAGCTIKGSYGEVRAAVIGEIEKDLQKMSGRGK